MHKQLNPRKNKHTQRTCEFLLRWNAEATGDEVERHCELDCVGVEENCDELDYDVQENDVCLYRNYDDGVL